MKYGAIWSKDPAEGSPGFTKCTDYDIHIHMTMDFMILESSRNWEFNSTI